MTIDLERNAWSVLGLMLRFQRTDENGACNDGLVWTLKMIAHALRLTELNADEAILWLIERKYVERRDGEYYTRSEGRLAYQEMLDNPRFQTAQSVAEFRDEVLTGANRYGRQSKLENAVLPSPQRKTTQSLEEDIIKRCTWARKVATIGSELGLGFTETLNGLNSGQIRRCNDDHWGFFYPHNGKNGQKWQYQCRECQKKYRKSRVQRRQK